MGVEGSAGNLMRYALKGMGVERERERDRQTVRQTDRQTDTAVT